MHLAVIMFVMRTRHKERERKNESVRERDPVRLGWQVSRRLLQASVLPFDTTGFVEQTRFSSFFLSVLPSLKLSLSACNLFRAFIISLPQISPFLMAVFF